MLIAKIIVDRTAIRIAWKHKIPKGIIGAKVQIEYADDVWNALNKTAVFQGHTTKDIIDVDTEVIIPPEVVADAGAMLFMGLYGVDANNNIALPTMWVPLGVIQNAADPSGDTSTDSTLPVWAQLEQKYESLLSMADRPQQPTISADWQASPSEPNHILNRTHWVEYVEMDCTFDGDLTGRKYIQLDDETFFVKISDEILTADNLYGQTVTVYMDSNPPEEEIIELSPENVIDVSSEGLPAIIAADALVCVQSDFTFSGIFVEKGVYFLCACIDGTPYAYVKTVAGLNSSVERVHKLDNKYLDMQWCANINKNGREVIFPETTQVFDGVSAKQNFIFQIENGKEYGINWDGTYYHCKVSMYGSAFFSVNYLGNGHLYSSDFPETDEPFCVYSIFIGGILVTTRISTTESGETHTVGIYQINNVNNRIPYDFLPRVYVMPTDIGFNDIQMDELAEAHNTLQLGGKVYARYNNSTYQVLQAHRDFIDDMYDSLCMVSGSNFYMWGKKRGWTGFSSTAFTITTNNYHINNNEVSGKKYRFTVDEAGTLIATDVTDTPK